MRELGQLLRTKRESLGLSLDELQEKTKIRKRYLIALEEGNWSVLPGDVYARGFVRSYAEVLGLDGLNLLHTYVDKNQGSPLDESATFRSLKDETKETLGQYAEQEQNDTLQPVREKFPSSPTVRPRRSDRKPAASTRLLSGRKFNGMSQAAVVVGVLVVIGGGLYFLKHTGGATNASSAANTTAFKMNQTANQTALNATTLSNGMTANTSANATANQTMNTAQTNGTDGSTGGAAKSSVVVTPQSFQNGVQMYSVTSAQPLAVSLTANSGSCWVKVTADNNVIDGSDLIAQGQNKTWSANQNLTIRVGNVPGVQITVNGQAVTLPSVNYPINITFVRQ